jgi:hypothetical protein
MYANYPTAGTEPVPPEAAPVPMPSPFPMTRDGVQIPVLPTDPRALYLLGQQNPVRNTMPQNGLTDVERVWIAEWTYPVVIEQITAMGLQRWHPYIMYRHIDNYAEGLQASAFYCRFNEWTSYDPTANYIPDLYYSNTSRAPGEQGYKYPPSSPYYSGPY